MKLRERLPATAYDRPVSALMLFVALLVIGAIAWARIPIQMMPDGFDPGFLGVWIPHPNSSPQETDEQVVQPVLDELGTVSGIQQYYSRASEGSAWIGIEFANGIPMDEAYNQVTDRMERALIQMPSDVERYALWRYNPSDQPILWAGMELPDDVADPNYVVSRVVQPRLERIPGVAAIDSWGVAQRGVTIDYDKERLYAHGVNLGPVIGRLSSDNFQMTGGRVVEEGQVRLVRSISPIEGVDDLRAFPVKESVDLGDIADVELRYALSPNIGRINGKEAAGLAIKRDASANTVEVAEAVQQAMTELESDPRAEGAKFFVFFNQGDLIGDSVDTLAETAMTGGVFAVIILFVFLREWRMTLLIAASIPFSMLITVGLLYFQGYSLNLLSLMGLMLAVGMVVDNAIVVVETIYRYRSEGHGVRDAAIRGTGEVNLAIVLSTMTTMVVFLPVILMSQSARFGFFLAVLGMPVVYALAASLVVALVFAPLATRYMGESQVKPDPRWLVALSDRYAATLAWVTSHRADAGMALLVMGVLTTQVALPGVQWSSSDEENLNDFVIRFSVPPQADIQRRDEIVKVFEELVEDHRDDWGVRVYRSQLWDGDREGRINVYLEQDGPLPREEVMEACEAVLPTDLPGVTATIGWDGSTDGGGNGKSLDLRIYGEDTDALMEVAAEVARRVRGVDGVLGVHLDVENEGADELRLTVDRDAASRYGVSASDVGRLVAFAMRGSAFPDIRDEQGREIGVGGRFALEDRSSVDKLLAFDVWSPITGGMVPLTSLTAIDFAKGPAAVRRFGRDTSTSITVDLDEDVTDEAVYAGLDAALADMVFPEGIAWSKGSRFQEQEEENGAMGLALLLSVVFVYLLIGVLFESWILPMSIITTIPMAMMGALWGLYLSGTPMDTMAGVGLVILVGVVVNNGIVLVDLITQLRAEGMDRDLALVEAGRRRLRPILMTALTTICGLLPMALGSSTFIGIPYAPLGRTVIGGLLAATLLTLLFVPTLYSVLDDVRHGWTVWLRYVRRGSP